ncbi:MAG: 2OG-Fe(II) oxygenase [Hyphomicrobiales bacterium]
MVTGSIAMPDPKAFVDLRAGDPAPRFHAASTSNPRYAFDTTAGRYIVMCFFGSARDEEGAATLRAVEANRQLFDDEKASFFGVSVDPADREQGRAKASLPGIRFFWDFDGAVSRAFGAVPIDVAPGGRVTIRRFWLVLDPTLRVMRAFPFEGSVSHQAEVFAYVAALPPVDQHAGLTLQAPILFLPNVFEPEFCQKLIALHEENGGEQSGFMREVDGKTVRAADPFHKQRKDYIIEDQEIVGTTQARIKRRIVPEIAKVHQFHATRMERFIVGCYAAEDGGHFRAHRDNTTKGTAHRRFAVSINLNSEFEGGEISFPEYGSRGFKPPPGGAVVFSCSLLHAVAQVTRGRRYAFLPFLYDDAAAQVRAQNNQYLDEGIGKYTAT